MKKWISVWHRKSSFPRIVLASAIVVGIAVVGCKSVPMTGRRQLVLVSTAQEVKLGEDSYREILSAETPSTNEAYVELVNRVGSRIAKVADRSDFDWEFRVIASPTQNAFCLPGGKVAIYEGMLPVCANEAGLAVVMSHEIAHALARHGSERMSHGYVVNGVQTVASKLMQNQEEATRQRVMQAYGIASQYGFILPYSRKHESEADQIGLMLLAKAGYDPSEAPRFWRRFADMKEGDAPAEFLSTHPWDERRANELEAMLPEAMELYVQAETRHGLGDAIPVAKSINQEQRTARADERPAASAASTPAPDAR
ncbi:MAG: M48 family metallopeptidase [Planctomycetales bacterium]|nr:M48 family metallopeptidase [Planctomycetales bacterium]